MKALRPVKRRSFQVEMTNLIDVIFILLLFFILTSTFANPALVMDLPQGTNNRPPADKALVVSLKSDGRLYLDAQLVTREHLASVLAEALRQGPQPVVTLQGDRLLRYEAIFALLDFIKSCGVEKINLANQAGS